MQNIIKPWKFTCSSFWNSERKNLDRWLGRKETITNAILNSESRRSEIKINWWYFADTIEQLKSERIPGPWLRWRQALAIYAGPRTRWRIIPHCSRRIESIQTDRTIISNSLNKQKTKHVKGLQQFHVGFKQKSTSIKFRYYSDHHSAFSASFTCYR